MLSSEEEGDKALTTFWNVSKTGSLFFAYLSKHDWKSRPQAASPEEQWPWPRVLTYLWNQQGKYYPKSGFEVVLKPEANCMDAAPHMDDVYQLQSLQAEQNQT